MSSGGGYTREANMNDEGKLFVGGLNFKTTDAELKEAFSKYGPITDAVVVNDRDTQTSRGFGFVTFANPEDAKDAKSGMDGKELTGRCIRVDEAGKPSGRSGGGGFRGGGQRGGHYRERQGYMGGDYEGGQNRSYGGNRNHGDDDRNSRGYRSWGNSRGGGGGGGGGYNAGYSRDNRSQNTYGEQRSAGNYRGDYESYPSND